ncbi:hypothetical protein AB205_0085500 [Aquarana catesbeiana]|uniref:Uncharacterized protein n=1 Tax=Aquarana catesbeiana TaxID=8400 RepID=A0A2G9QKH2_AQUCT|nr:hypothetical protein AB205_0085500 [Aquarana catesbeiana]
MAETQQVRDNSSNDEESLEPETSRSRRRFKASNMSFVEMVEMVDILKWADYGGKYGLYIPTHPKEDMQGGEVEEVGEIVTTTGDVDVVEEETYFNGTSAQILVGEIMVCNRELEKIKENINDVEKRLNNIIDVLGRI